MDSLKIETVEYQDYMVMINQIRTKVFQEEQGVAAELEFDGLDPSATHFLAYINGQAIATARIREIDGDTIKIERLAVLPDYRKQGIGKHLMRSALSTITQRGKSLAIVHAQAYIAQLYQQLGFEIVGEQFNEAGIPHVKMIKMTKQL
ncbi:GNAT family N-acetyltransferase [Pleurocapsa sp. CCALA 161]|uniref:GNAT family N-acetyltransferase n=1 Tax=Pleurocapsa sp. CCALA 161 TaxID=2107688 RepID=UPI000D04BB81|nr:GNAT family N-acetyltransferase [Pleurocapsa sp. CCALA 161]PSB07214.1 GNAT family N-acetyltransferase [Pleurocapsa sp. CCALA 161]